MSQVTLNFQEDGKVTVDVEEVTIDSSVEEDEEVKKVVSQYLGGCTPGSEGSLSHLHSDSVRYDLMMIREKNDT